MALIDKICINNSWISTYRAKNGNTVQIVKNSIPNIISRTRTLISDPAGNPIKCKDITVRKGALVSADTYMPAKDGSMIIKDKNGVTKLFTNLRFLDIASIFLK